MQTRMKKRRWIKMKRETKSGVGVIQRRKRQRGRPRGRGRGGRREQNTVFGDGRRKMEKMMKRRRE